MMKKKINIMLNIVIPTAVAYIVFFLLYSVFQQRFFEYRWLAIIPFIIVTGYVIKDNMREWKVIKQNS
jgi:glucan phosphoethanolaminetransferase (alkaline phosphatase superfamily)